MEKVLTLSSFQRRLDAVMTVAKKIATCALPSVRQYCNDVVSMADKALTQFQTLDAMGMSDEQKETYEARLFDVEKAAQLLKSYFSHTTSGDLTADAAKKLYNATVLLTDLSAYKEASDESKAQDKEAPEAKRTLTGYGNEEIERKVTRENETIKEVIYGEKISDSKNLHVGPNGELIEKNVTREIYINPPIVPAAPAPAQPAAAEATSKPKEIDGETITMWAAFVVAVIMAVFSVLFGCRVIPNFLPNKSDDALFSGVSSGLSAIVFLVAIIVAACINNHRKKKAAGNADASKKKEKK